MNTEKYKLLLGEAERIFGKDIVTTQDSKEFVDSIFNSTSELISYNTIRRMYNVVSSEKVTPSKSTLNILANYCGFRSFIDFSDNFNIQNIRIEFYNECYLKFYKNQKIDFDIINLICSQKQDFFTFDFLKKAIHIAFTYEDLDFLIHLFELDSVLKTRVIYTFIKII